MRARVALPIAAAIVVLIAFVGPHFKNPSKHHRALAPSSTQPAHRCPEDAVWLVQARTCIAGDDFAEGTDLRTAADHMLGYCKVGHAVVSIENKRHLPTEIVAWCSGTGRAT